MSKNLSFYQGNGETNDYEIMRKKWTDRVLTRFYVYSEKAKKDSLMERRKKDRISSQESKSAEPGHPFTHEKITTKLCLQNIMDSKAILSEGYFLLQLSRR